MWSSQNLLFEKIGRDSLKYYSITEIRIVETRCVDERNSLTINNGNIVLNVACHGFLALAHSGDFLATNSVDEL